MKSVITEKQEIIEEKKSDQNNEKEEQKNDIEKLSVGEKANINEKEVSKNIISSKYKKSVASKVSKRLPSPVKTPPRGRNLNKISGNSKFSSIKN